MTYDEVAHPAAPPSPSGRHWPGLYAALYGAETHSQRNRDHYSPWPHYGLEERTDLRFRVDYEAMIAHIQQEVMSLPLEDARLVLGWLEGRVNEAIVQRDRAAGINDRAAFIGISDEALRAFRQEVV